MTAQWGLLSTAQINDAFIEGVAQSSQSAVLAVASRDRARAEQYASERGIERAYDSYQALLTDPDIDAIYISLPNSLHLEWASRALEAGKHVLCEKPLSRREADVRAAFDLAERHDRLLMEAFMYRHHPQTARVVELVESGAIGRLRLVRAAFSFHFEDPADVRLSADLNGGALMDVGCYCVSAARLLAGEPELVCGTQVVGGDGVDVIFGGWMRFGGDVIAHFDSGLVLDDRFDLEVVGEEASLFLADPWHCVTPRIELRRAHTVEIIEVPGGNSYGLEADNLAAAIRGEAAPLLGRADAEGQARAIEALYASADSGAPVAPPR
ncbi:MAG TPA: Gfo/Idh/MocA family oxidoreductase [Solirubrobacteraceae bacterium]|jgi:predicted dehydrogenase|nr:Gfo/Idh/MocA family oxidoreductase [Solirubrobacteraceae bacterium]